MNLINISKQIKRVLWGGLRRDLALTLPAVSEENARHLDLATTAVWDRIRDVRNTVVMAIEDEMIITR